MASGKYRAFISYSQAADGKLAPAIQTGLQRFSKPWYRLRALSVFRDATGLSATPELWGAIEHALKESKYFILLASPPAARSPWVEQEVDWWLTHKAASHLLIVWTDGTLVWDRALVDFDWDQTDALPRRLEKAFAQEPLYLDLRWARRRTDLSLRQPRFADAIANLSATLRGQSLDELFGEDVRQHERTIRLLRGAVAVLLVLTICAVFAAFVALQARNTAERVARGQTTNADLERNEVRSRRLASVSLNEASDPDLQILLAVEAVNAHPTPEAEGALRQSLFASLKPALTFPTNQGPASYGAFSPDGRTVLVFGDTVPRLYDASNGALVREFHHGTNEVFQVGFVPRGGRIYSTSGDRVGRLWDVATGKPVAEFPHEGLIATLVSPDESRVLTLSANEDAILWDAKTAKKVAELECQPASIFADPVPEVSFQPNGQQLALRARSDLAIVEIKTGQRLRFLEGHTRVPRSVDFSPDGNWLVTASEDGTARRWRATTGQNVSTWKHDAELLQARFSPAGKWVVARDANRQIVIWEVASGRTAATLELRPQPESPVFFEFSPNEVCLVTASFDSGTAQIWDLSTGSPLAEIENPDAGIRTLQFSSDSKRLILGGLGIPVAVFPCDVCGSVEDLLALARSRVSRTLTPEERNKYLRD